MSVPRERFRDGLTWDDWLDRLGRDAPAWRRRFDETTLAELRAEYQSIPTPRYVACFFDPDSPAAQEAVPVVARACDQAAVAGGVDLRLFPIDAYPDFASRYPAEADRSLPVCVVFDRDWVQVGIWRMRPDVLRETDWIGDALRGLLDALRGLPNPPWQGRGRFGEHLWKQAEHGRGGD
ncbi:MAG TPA: thioredoxin family protein [Longimicrobiales bacterium]